MAGRGLRAGMAVTDAGWVSAGLAWAGRSREGEQRGECSDPVPGCILPCAAPPLQLESHRASSGWLTLPLAIPITQALLLCFQPWFSCYLLTLHSIGDDNETNGCRENTVTPLVYIREILLHQGEQYRWRVTYNPLRGFKNKGIKSILLNWTVSCFHYQFYNNI